MHGICFAFGKMIVFRLFSTIALLLIRVSPNAAHAKLKCQLGLGQESHTVGGNGTTGAVWPWQIYQSSPFNPPQLEISQNGDPLAEGLIFMTPSNFGATNSIKEAAPIIMTDQGQLVWNGPNKVVTNLRATTYQGAPILTYWSGVSSEGGNVGHGYGNITFVDDSYRTILTVCPKLDIVTPEGTQYPCQADFHESFLTDRDTLLVSASNATPADLSVIGGPKDGWIFDSLVFEIDPESEKILFRWSAIEHIPVSQTKLPLGSSGTKSVPFDYFHVNSIVNVGDSYLVNGRHTWTLQGETGGDFGPLPHQGRFVSQCLLSRSFFFFLFIDVFLRAFTIQRWQHYAMARNVTNSSFSVSYFNNANAAPDNGSHPSSGLELQLQLPPNKSTSPRLLQRLVDPSEMIYADSQGSTQFLPNGDVFLNYGQIAIMKEFGAGAPSGGVLKWTARLGQDNRVQNYRGFKQMWHATPDYPPSLVLRRGNGTVGCATGYVSWNGATDVTAWEIREKSGQGHLHKVGKIGYRGFETNFGVKGNCAQAVALAGKRVLGESNVACVS
ncbi:MAG: hypothetical protein Q9170_002396 [Blastenia crenularia]